MRGNIGMKDSPITLYKMDVTEALQCGQICKIDDTTRRLGRRIPL